jgi:hypothetical protein
MEVQVANYHITVHGSGRGSLADLVRVHGIRVYPQTLHQQDQDNRVDAVADEDTIGRLTGAGYRIDRHEDVDEDAKDSLRHVGLGNRFLPAEQG